MPLRGVAWVGDPLYDGTVGGAIRHFKSLLPDQQNRVEMLVDPGIIEGTQATIVSFDELKVIAARPDVPEL